MPISGVGGDHFIGNAGLCHLWASLRARREAIIRVLALLRKGAPFPAQRAWHPKGTSCGARLLSSRHAKIRTLHWREVHKAEVEICKAEAQARHEAVRKSCKHEWQV